MGGGQSQLGKETDPNSIAPVQIEKQVEQIGKEDAGARVMNDQHDQTAISHTRVAYIQSAYDKQKIKMEDTPMHLGEVI